MKIRYIKYWAFAAVLGMGTVSCEDFLNRPTEDNYNESNFYQIWGTERSVNESVG